MNLKKLFTIMFLTILVASPFKLHAATSWESVLDSDFTEVANLETAEGAFSAPGTSGGLEVSSGFTADPDTPGSYILDNQRSDSIGEYFIYKDVLYPTSVGDQTFDIKVTISAVDEYSSGTVDTELTVSPNFWINSTGYKNIQFNVEIINSDTLLPIDSPIGFLMTDIDAAQIMSIHGLDKDKYIISEESILQYRENDANIEFTSENATELYDKTAVLAQVETPFTFNFALNYNLDTLDPTNYGGSFKLDVRVPEQTGSINLYKVDEEGHALAGAEFTLYDNEGDIVQTLVTNEDGYAETIPLKLGEYTVTETKAPDGYALSNPVFSENITLTHDGQVITLNSSKPIVNEHSRGTIEITKVDSESKNTLAGAEFDIIDSEGIVVDHVVTDEVGLATSTDLPLGDYTIVETIAPDGYTLDDTSHDVTITTNGELVQIEIENMLTQIPNITTPEEVISEASTDEVTPMSLATTGGKIMGTLVILLAIVIVALGLKRFVKE